MSFRKFDVYRKTVDGVNVQTRIGGAVSLVSFVIVSLLIITEIKDYLARDLVSRMKVESGSSTNVVNIWFDILFPDVVCSKLTFEQETNSETKHPAKVDMKSDNNGRGCSVIGNVYTDSVSGFLKLSVGSPENVPVINTAKKIVATKAEDEYGYISHSIRYMEVLPETLSAEQLAQYSKDLHNPLNSQNTTLADGIAMHQYHMQIVPTSYKPLSMDTPVVLYQYSVSERSIERSFPRDAFALNGHNIPKFHGLVFTYDFYPVTVMMEERKEGFFEFLINLCAIVGGVVTVLGLVNVGLHSSAKTLIGKND